MSIGKIHRATADLPPWVLAKIAAAKKLQPPKQKRSHGGKATDLGGQFYRSAWERNYARYLRWLLAQKRIDAWAYEPKEFWFPGIERGTRSYLPDFWVELPDGREEWHEVKGWLDPQSKTRLKRMAKYFPHEKVVLIDAAWFRASARTLAAVVPNWETGESR